MGHVDHGKTTLLDAIRESAVVETEAGGITQHIGAYQVDHDGRRITFLDTPGHEAFTALRARGAKVTDIAVLVVAADDGVMPQTRRVDQPRARGRGADRRRREQDRPAGRESQTRAPGARHARPPAGGVGRRRRSSPTSPRRRSEGLDDLLEKILLVADAELELNANPNAEASGPIIESRLDVGRGPVATMLVQRGTLRVGDAIVAGDAWGKVRALHDYRGERVEEAGPGDAGRDPRLRQAAAGAASSARVVENDRQARHLARPARPAAAPRAASRAARRRASRSRISSRSIAGGRASRT